MMSKPNAGNMNERVRHINEIIRQSQQRSVLPMRLLDVGKMMENSSSDGIHFDRPRGMEWLNGVFLRHINVLESNLVETGQFTFGPPPRPSFFPARPVMIAWEEGSILEKAQGAAEVDNWFQHPWIETEQSSAVSSVVVVDN